MYSYSFLGFEIYYLLFYFIFFSFGGWLLETVRLSLKSKKFINRGFLYSPFCPIYGFGMLMIIIFLSEYKNSTALLIVLGALFSSILEYLTSFLLEKLFNAKWWDYSYRKLNIKGRISLDISCFWGILSLIMIRYAVPLINHIIVWIPKSTGTIFLNLFLLLFSIDLIVTVYNLISFNTLIEKLAKSRVEFYDISVNMINTIKNQMKSSDVNIKSEKKLKKVIAEFYLELLQKTELDFSDLKERLKTKFAAQSRRDYFDEIFNMQEMQGNFNDFKRKYSLIYKRKMNHFQRRLLRAFPNFRLVDSEKNNLMTELKKLSSKK